MSHGGAGASPTLASGERLLWQGHSEPGLRFGWVDLPVTLFMLFWAGLPAQIAWTSVSEGRGFDPFLLIFLVIGFYMLIGRFAVDAWIRSRTSYYLTSRRAVIRRDGPWPQERSVTLAAVADIQFKPAANGRGTIRFGSNSSLGWNRQGWQLTGAPGGPPEFARINDAARVYDLAIRAQNGG